jgi:outer membrane protein TolC
MNKIPTMKRTTLFLIITLFALIANPVSSQELKKLTLEDVIKIAETQSPNALIATHRFRASYWQYKSFVAQYRPSLTLTGTTPDYSTAYTRVYAGGQWIYAETNMLQDVGSLALTQNIGPTGGSISLQSDLTLQNDFKAKTDQYVTTPISIRLNQPIFRYNSLRWQKKTEPLKYETAKKTYISAIETVHSDAVRNFFALALAQINKQIAMTNYLNADTLYQIAKGRYQLGTIAEDELLQMQGSWLNAESSRRQADMNLRDREIRLKSFLGYNANVNIELILPSQIPNLQVDTKEVLDLAMKNNPDIMNQQLTLLNAQASLAQAKGDNGFNGNITASYGLQGKNADFNSAYDLNTTNKNQGVRLSFTMPILDWGLAKGKIRMARSSLELAQVQVAQSQADFQQNLSLDVEQFNMQRNLVEVAALSDTVAQKRYEVTKARFMIGKIAVLDLNDADTRKDQNRRAYVQSLQDYWSYFYNMRSLTLFDFVNRKPIEVDYDDLINKK